MRITKVNLQNNLIGGLHPVKMEKLGEVILIAGRNGSGKSRLLQNVHQALSNKQQPAYIKGIFNNRDIIENHISAVKKSIQSNPSDQYLLTQLHNANQELLNTNIVLEKYLEIDLMEDIGIRYVIDFVPKAVELNDPMDLSKNSLSNFAKSIGENLGVGNLNVSTLACIQHIQDAWREASNPDYAYPEEKENAINSYNNLNDSIFSFLGEKLSRDKNGVATLFGQEIGKANLSKGQIVLLQLCIALYAQGAKLCESIIMMDEPENHLHPEALIDLYNKIKSVLTNGQLWIATHSIHLLAHVSPSSIWYMENGSVNYAGKVPEKVLNGLLGGENEIAKLADFLNLPAQMASIQFAFECLFPPFAIDTGTDDPQTSQIIEAIKSTIQSRDLKKILDFGAGQARLLSAIVDTDGDLATPSWLDYFAYDTFDTYKEICEQKITSIYGGAIKRYFLSEQDLIQNTPRKSFDFIVMCNVFHEIDPKDWLTMFSEHGALRSCLSDDGYLLIIEDQLIPIGEKAYKNGFLVFDVEQFKILFNIDTYQFRSKKNDRLKCHFIPSSSLKNVTSETRKKSVENFNQRALERVKNLRTQDANISNGRLHAFWSQQATNSQLVLSELG